ncbi:DUF3558 family protein [Nocardiopsis valliformis]|uniref:DUF3558 family protein n=1 Tax=Nocardiopsis valliformis TaxID=239974 RepID=UPI00034D31C1|nr:DUF3558 family protein [Nocardiopsis valliformis]
MRGRGRVATAAAVALVIGCSGEIELADRDSIDQFDVPALDLNAEHPCDLLPDATAVELGILHEDGSGSAQSDGNCYFTNRVDASVDVRVDLFDEDLATESAVATTVSAAFSGADGQEFASVGGYPGFTTAFPDSCNLTVATSDEHELFVQVSADDACDTAVKIARTVIANSPEL